MGYYGQCYTPFTLTGYSESKYSSSSTERRKSFHSFAAEVSVDLTPLSLRFGSHEGDLVLLRCTRADNGPQASVFAPSSPRANSSFSLSLFLSLLSRPPFPPLPLSLTHTPSLLRPAGLFSNTMLSLILLSLIPTAFSKQLFVTNNCDVTVWVSTTFFYSLYSVAGFLHRSSPIFPNSLVLAFSTACNH